MKCDMFFVKHVVNCLIFQFLSLLHLASSFKNVFSLQVFINSYQVCIIIGLILTWKYNLPRQNEFLVKNNDLYLPHWRKV